MHLTHECNLLMQMSLKNDRQEDVLYINTYYILCLDQTKTYSREGVVIQYGSSIVQCRFLNGSVMILHFSTKIFTLWHLHLQDAVPDFFVCDFNTMVRSQSICVQFRFLAGAEHRNEAMRGWKRES